MARQDTANRADWVVSGGVPVYAVAHAKATVRGSSTVDADIAKLEKQVAQSGTFTATSAAVNVDAWEETDDGVRAVIPVTGVTETTFPVLYVDPEDDAVKLQCGFSGRCTPGKGTVTVYAKITPRSMIRLVILAMFSQSEEREVEVVTPDSSVTAYYKLPVATAETLGGVRIGQNIDVTEDGVISIPKMGCNHVLSGGIAGPSHVHDDECMKDLLAAPDDVSDALDCALGIDGDAEPPAGGAEEPPNEP